MKNILTKLLAVVATLFITACGTFQLETSAKMTNSIFLKDLNPEKTIFLVSTNTTGKDSDFHSKIESELVKKGYELMDSPDASKYILRVNLVNNINSIQQNEARAAAGMGATGAVVAGLATKNVGSAVGTGLAAAAVGGIFAYATADGSVRMQADVLITEKFTNKPSEDFLTRVISEARQVHLEPKEGQVILEGVMSKKIAGIFL